MNGETAAFEKITVPQYDVWRSEGNRLKGASSSPLFLVPEKNFRIKKRGRGGGCLF